MCFTSFMVQGDGEVRVGVVSSKGENEEGVCTWSPLSPGAALLGLPAAKVESISSRVVSFYPHNRLGELGTRSSRLETEALEVRPHRRKAGCLFFSLGKCFYIYLFW